MEYEVEDRYQVAMLRCKVCVLFEDKLNYQYYYCFVILVLLYLRYCFVIIIITLSLSDILQYNEQGIQSETN